MEEQNTEIDMAIAGIYHHYNDNYMIDETENSQLTQDGNLIDISDSGSLAEKRVEEKRAELATLLSNWKLEFLLEHLIGQQVFVDVLKVLKRHHIPTLILKTFNSGIQIMFEHNLEEWRQSIGLPLPCYYGDIPPPLSPHSFPATSPSTSRTPTPSRFQPYNSVEKSGESSSTLLSLSNILSDNEKGSMLVEYYEKYSKFHEEQRTALINLVVQIYEEKRTKMSLSASFKLEKEILEKFPTEKLEFYRTGKRGRIYNRYINVVTSFRSVVQKQARKPSKAEPSENNYRHKRILDPEDDADSCIRALKFDNLTADEFDSTWKACTQYRLTDIRSLATTSAIMEKWPFYKNPTGFRMIDMDYNVAFKNGDDLMNCWPQFIEKMINFLCSDNNLKEKNVKLLVEEIKSNSNIDENSRNGALLLALHGYFVPTGKIVKKDNNGKNSTTKFTIKDSQDSFLFVANSMEELEDHLMFMKSHKANIQPFVFCIGKNIFNIESIYLYFDDIRYKMFSLLRAVDLCFKTIYLFNLNFPQESVMFYTFIETFFFKFESQQTFRKVHIISEYLRN